MRFSHISLGALALAIATPALADPLPVAPGAPANDVAAPALDPMTPVDAAAADAPVAPADDAPPKKASAFTFTGGVTLTSDYRFRGLTQTDEGPAVQATLGISHSSGLYIGTWVSQIDGGLDGSTPALKGYGGAEIDLYAGFTRTLKSGLGFDVGLLYYYYGTAPSAGPNTDFFEPYASVNYTIGPVNAKVGAAYAWGGQKGLDFTSGSDDDIYVYGELAVGIPKTPITLKGHLGYTSGSLGLVNIDSKDNYIDYSLTAEAAISGVKVGVSYVGTNISNTFGVYQKGSEVVTGKFAQVYGRGSTVVGYIGYSF
jgi:uncharacterized protein (TIGR02001 family)